MSYSTDRGQYLVVLTSPYITVADIERKTGSLVGRGSSGGKHGESLSPLGGACLTSDQGF